MASDKSQTTQVLIVPSGGRHTVFSWQDTYAGAIVRLKDGGRPYWLPNLYAAGWKLEAAQNV